MRCLNPACESLSAIELNISLNMYGGDEYTDYGDPGALIATSCSGDDDSCETITYVADWLEIVLSQIKPTGTDMVLTASQTAEVDWDEYLNASPGPLLCAVTFDPVERCGCSQHEKEA